MSTQRPKQRTALVTGASRGIGRAIAQRLEASGARVLAPGRNELDLESADSVVGWLAANALVEIDILVNNAGINPIRPIPRLTLADWARTLAVDLTAPFLLIQGLAPGMAARGWGRIVNIGSCYGLVSRAERAAYSSAKSGLAGLTRTAAIEFGRNGVLVNTVAPGFIATELTYQNNTPEQIERLVAQVPVGRLGTPMEIAEHVAFLASEANTFLTGQVVAIDGGFMCQ